MQQPVPACLLIWSDLLPLLAGFPMANRRINYSVFNRLILGTTGWFSGFIYSNPCHLQQAKNWNWGYSKHHWYGALGKNLPKIAGNFYRTLLLVSHKFHQVILDTPVYAWDIRIKCLCSMPCMCFKAWLLCHGYQMRQHLGIAVSLHLAPMPASWQRWPAYQW